MQSYNTIMMEHDIIIKMLNEITITLDDVTKEKYIDPSFVDTAVDFIRVYADRTHHGKEEDILFKELRKKRLSNEDLQLMEELIKEHNFFRITTNALVEANKIYRKGDENYLNEVISLLKKLVKYYPQHVKKEANVFFPATQNYLSEEEDQAVIVEFNKFDRTMIHEKYKDVVKEVEAKNTIKHSLSPNI